MKFQRLKRQVFMETGIIAAVTMVLGAIIYLISMIDEDYESGNATLKQQVDTIDLEMNKLRAKYNNILQHMTIYQEVQGKQQDNRLAINRQMGLEKFNQFKAQYALNGLRLSVSPAQEMKDPTLKRKHAGVSSSDVSVSFDVVSDESIYEFLDTLRDELPGLCKVVRINMSLQKPLGDDVLREIAQKGTYPLIKTEARLTWYGINVIEPPPAASSTAAAPVPAINKAAP